MELAQEVGRYRAALAECVRLQDPAAYRQFVDEWRGLIQKGSADRLIEMDDAALAVRLARMAIEDPGLIDVHSRARVTLRQYGIVVEIAGGGRETSSRSRTVRLRRPPRHD